MRRVFLSLAIFVLCFQLVSAIDTNIHIKTVPNMNVNLLVVSSSFEQYQRFNANADQYGDISFVFSSDKEEFGLNIYVKDLQDNSKVASAQLEDQAAGEDIYVEVVPKNFDIIETPTEENISTTEEIVPTNLTEIPESSNESLLAGNEESSKISGKAIFGENSSIKKIIMYIGGAIVLAVIVFFAFKLFKKRKGKEIKITKLSDWKEGQKDTPREYYGVLEETQKRLEETQKELNMVKNKERIKETEEKLRRDEQELRNLRGF
jgi:hypothetical protein